MRINTNINAMVATNQMAKNTALSGASMEKLSTGLRITKAGDDAAGLAISEKMRSQIRGMEQADRNVQDGISLVQTAEGAMEEIGNITQRMRELAVQGANETNSASDRGKIVEELSQLHSEIKRISTNTKFNGENILDGGGVSLDSTNANTEILDQNTNISNFKIDSTKIGDATSIKLKADGNTLTLELLDANQQSVGSQTINVGTGFESGHVRFDNYGVSFDLVIPKGQEVADQFTELTNDLKTGGGSKDIKIQVGANTVADSDNFAINIDAMTVDSLGIDLTDIGQIAQAGTAGTNAATAFIDVLDNALEDINSSRAKLGAQQNRLEYTSANLTSATENLSAAESRIRDVDVAKEMVKLSKLNILNQASQAMVSQAKQQPESVSQLLR